MKQETSKDSPVLGLALSGGAARGFAHLGVIQALEHQNIYPDCISGTSVGAIIGGLYAFGVHVQDIRAEAEKLKLQNVSSFTFSKLGLLNNDDIGRFLENMIGKVNIEDAQIPLAITATDISTGDMVVFRSGDLAEAAMASSCIPGIFTPVNVGDKKLVDGMLVANLPVSPLKSMEADVIVAVSLGTERMYKEPDSIFDVVLNSLNIALDRANAEQGIEADVHITPYVADVSLTDIKNAAKLFSEGYRAGSEAVESIKSVLKFKKEEKSSLINKLFKKSK